MSSGQRPSRSPLATERANSATTWDDMTEGLLVFVKWVVSSPWRRKPTAFYPSRVSRRPCPVAWHSTLTLTHTKRRPKCLEQSSSKTLLDCSIFTTQSSRNMPFTLQSDLPVHRAYVISHCSTLLGDVVLQQKLSLIQLLSFFFALQSFFLSSLFSLGLCAPVLPLCPWTSSIQQ